jgi:hypothetical protein
MNTMNRLYYDQIRRLLAVIFLALLAAPGCDEEKPPEDSYTAAEIAKKREMLGLDKPEEEEAAREAPAPAPEPERPALSARPALVALNPTLEEAAALLPEDPIGELTGTFFESPSTQTRDLLGVVVTRCGDGVVLQGVYAPGEGEKGPIHTTTPIPLAAVDLIPGMDRTYTDSGFTIALKIVHAELPTRLAGSLTITSKKTGLDFIKMTFDGPTLPALLPVAGAPSLERFPLMSACWATGRYDLTTASGEVFSGLVNAIDYGDRGVPRVRVPLSSVDTLEVLLIPPKPFTTMEEPTQTKLQLVSAPNSRPFVMLVHAYHHPQALDPEQATGRNLRKLHKAQVTEGDVSVTLTGKTPRKLDKGAAATPRADADDLWTTHITLTNLKTSLKVRGPLKDRTITKLEIKALLMDTRAPLSALPAGVEAPSPIAAPTPPAKKEDGAPQ